MHEFTAPTAMRVGSRRDNYPGPRRCCAVRQARTAGLPGWRTSGRAAKAAGGHSGGTRRNLDDHLHIAAALPRAARSNHSGIRFAASPHGLHHANRSRLRGSAIVAMGARVIPVDADGTHSVASAREWPTAEPSALVLPVPAHSTIRRRRTLHRTTVLPAMSRCALTAGAVPRSALP
jgi:hypothetical protein